jgi:glucan biosynthesis protein
MIRHAYRLLIASVLGAGAVVTLGAPARAQVLGYDEVRNCVCYEQQMSHWRSEVDVRGGIMRERDADFQHAKQQLAAAQQSANPNSEADLDRIRMLIDQVGQMRTALQEQIVPSYNQSVAQLNAVVARYNQQCAGYTLFVELVNRAKAAGACPVQ